MKKGCIVCVSITLFWAKYAMCANHALSGELLYVCESHSFGWNMVCVRITLFWAKYGMCANHALSGEIFYRKSRMTRSENKLGLSRATLEINYRFSLWSFIIFPPKFDVEVPNLGLEKNGGQEKNLCPEKKFGSRKKCGSQKNVGPENNLSPEKNLCPEKKFVSQR